MEHLREHWRQVTASKRALYRGISLEGASRQYAWGLDEAIVRKFSSAMKKGDHQAAAKVGSERVGNLEWYGRTGEVYEVVVRADHRRRGLATAMWDFAQDAPKKPKHSNQGS